MPIKWDNAWNIGHAEIDKQHQRWIDVYNRLENAFLNNQPNMQVMQRETLKQLIEYANYHFTTEEKFMIEKNYPEAANHWRLHKDFRFVLNEKLRLLKEGEWILCSDLLMLMRNWLERHILVEDRKIVMFVKSLSDCRVEEC